MSTLSQVSKTLGSLAFALVVGLPAAAQTQADPKLGLGAPVTPQELRPYFAIQPDGRTLPTGRGTASEGQTVYRESCAACHGDHLEGNLRPGIGGDRLIGGRGSLASPMPVKTVESYWPYATTLFDYIKRAMPFNAPGSLNDDQVYAVVAYILNQASIIGPNDSMDAEALPAIRMPNRDGFIPDQRPEVELYR